VEPGVRDMIGKQEPEIYMVDKATNGDDVELALDSAATGTIVRSLCKGLSDVRKKVRARVTGVSKGPGIEITHTAESEKVGKVHVVPDAQADLLSWPVLAKDGCKMYGEGSHITVYNPGGDLKFVANRNSRGLYTVRMQDIQSYPAEVMEV